MGKNLKKSGSIVVTFFLLFLFISENSAQGVVINNSTNLRSARSKPPSVSGNQRSPEHQYAPGEVLVKFKETVNFEPASRKAVSQAIAQDIRFGFKAIERVHSIKPVVLDFKKTAQFVTTMSDEELFGEAYRKMSPLRQGLYRNYKIILEEDVSVEEAIIELKENPNVEYAYPNYIREAYYTPSDPRFPEQWALPKINAPEAWDIIDGCPDAVIAVIDTGVDYNHEDLSSNIWTNDDELPGNSIDDDGNGYVDDDKGWDFVSVPESEVYPGEDPGPRDNNPMDFHGHGTHCSGIAAAVTNNDTGLAGVAPNCKIMAVRAGYKAANGRGCFQDSDIEQAILYAIDNGAKVISMSFGGSEAGAIQDELETAYEEKIVLVAAAGNSGSSSMCYPAAMEEVLAVSATDSNDDYARWSNYGPWIDVAAPGVEILSALPDDQYESWSGTSMACPHVAGIAALLISQTPTLTNNKVYDTIRCSADDLGAPGRDDDFGYGRVNALTACEIKEASVFIDLPSSGSYIKGDVTILGSAYVESGFQEYRLYCAPKEDINNIIPINSSTLPVQNGELGVWYTAQYPEGTYILTLEVIYEEGAKTVYSKKELTVDNINEPPVFVNLNDIQIVGEDVKYAFKIEAIDPDNPDAPEGQLTYSASNLPPNALFYTGDHPLFSWPNARKGTYKTTFTVSDNENTVSKDVIFSTIHFEIIQMIEGDGTIWKPVMYGDKIAWTSHFNREDEDWTNDYDEVYMFDLSTSQKIQISDRYGVKGEPAIYENRIIWDEPRYPLEEPIYCDIFEHIYDPINPQEIQITASDSQKSSVAIYDDKVVWRDYRDGLCGIYMHDGVEERQIAPTYCGRNVAIYGNNIVWQDYEQGIWGDEIYLCKYDTVAPEVVKIADYNVLVNGLSIYEDKIVWSDERTMVGHDNIWGIYLYDILKAKEEFLITGCGANNPVIYEDKIVWKEIPTHSSQQSPITIYVYDLATSMKIPIVGLYDYEAPSNMEPYPTIYEDLIAYVVRTPGIGDHIFVGRLNFRNIDQPPVLEPIGDKDTNETQLLEFTVAANVPAFLFAENLPDGAQFTDNADGTALFYWLPQCDQAGVYEVTFTATDGDISDSETITMTVNEVPPPPAPHSLTATAISQDSITIEWQHDSPADIHRFQAYWATDPNGYWSIMNTPIPDDTTYTYSCTHIRLTPDTTYYYKVRAFAIGSNFSEYTDVVFATTFPPPLPPELDPIGDKEINEAQTLSFTITATDQNGDSLNFPDPVLPDGATFVDNGDNTADFAWTPGYAQAGNYSVTFTVSDGVLSDSESITITVKDTPPPPHSLTATTISHTKIFVEWQHDNPNDIAGFKIFRSLTPDGNWIIIGQVSADFMAVTAGSLQPDTTYYFKVQAYKSGGSYSEFSNIASATTLLPPLPPELDPIGHKVIDEGQALSFTITATDPNGDSLNFPTPELPEGATFVDNGDNTASFSWTPQFDQAGFYEVTFVVSDGALEDSETITIAVRDVNRPPILDSIGDKTTEIGRLLEFKITATDPDGDTLYFGVDCDTLGHMPDGATFIEQTFSWTPNIDQAGEYEFTFWVLDREPFSQEPYLKDWEKITITVNDTNYPPQILYLRNLWNRYFIWLGRDKEDGYRLKYSYRVDEKEWSIPTGMRWISISQISQGLEPGNHIFQVKAIDSEGAESGIKKIEFKVERNTPPEMLYLRNIRNYYLFWLGKDKEDGYNLRYSYRIDGGQWSYPSMRRWFLIRNLRLTRGKHLFEVKAIDKKGLESKIKSVMFIK